MFTRQPTTTRPAQPAPRPSGAAGRRAVAPERSFAFDRSGSGAPVLALSRPGDADEVQADRIAEQVMRPGAAFVPPGGGGRGGAPRVRRACARCGAAGGGCAGCEGEEARLRRKGASSGEPASAPAAAIRAVTDTPGRPLDPPTRAFFEARFGRDFGSVRVHTDGAAAESARSADALAYTLGDHVVFGAGNYAPATAQGQRLLAHELAHVAQHQEGAGLALRRQELPAPRAPGVMPPLDAPPEEVRRYLAERDELECRGDAMARPARCAFTPEQQSRVDRLRASALASAARASPVVRAGGPAVAALATRTFRLGAAPDFNALAAQIDAIAATLRSTSVECAGCGEPLCQRDLHPTGFVLAVVPDDRSRILLCPFFFAPEHSFINQRRTLLHEAGHVLGIDDVSPYVHPPYCSDADSACGDPCPSGSDLRNVDAWAWFIQCADRALSTQPSRCEFTSRERTLFTLSHYDALSTASQAAAAVGSHDRYMATLARRIFHVEPDLDRLADTAVRIHHALSRLPFVCGEAAEDLCAPSNAVTGRATTLAMMPEDMAGIVVCPPFLASGTSFSDRRRALLRLGAYAASADTARPVGSSPDCVGTPDCRDPCPGSLGPGNADAWARFLECAAFSR